MRYRDFAFDSSDGIGLIKSYQNKLVNLGQELNENNLRKQKIRSQRSQRHVAV
jgi:hypothetical protein